MKKRKVRGTASLYATEDGRIYCSKLKRFRALTRQTTGYLVVGAKLLSGAQTTMLVHRAVWSAFNRPISKGYHINHIDGVKTNNKLGNLECVTPLQNAQHYINVLGGYKKPWRKISDKKIEELRSRVASGETLKSIANDFGVTDRALSRMTRKNPASYKEHTGTFSRPTRKKVCVRQRGSSILVWYNEGGQQKVIGSSDNIEKLVEAVEDVVLSRPEVVWNLDAFNSAPSKYKRKPK